jgi:6-pyruvoyltetrahydropterin/6-carboxytetrahydropterin synthase
MHEKIKAQQGQAEVFLTCSAEFSASHFYRVPGWTEAENEREFGKSANPKGHGHNYRVEVSIKGGVNPKTGMVVNIRDLKKLVKEALEELDHRHLNEEIPYFKNNLPTPENLACYLFDKIASRVSVGEVAGVRVWESEDFCAEFKGEYAKT